jgi:hypothetical protein
MNILAEVDRGVLAGVIAAGIFLLAGLPVLVAHNRHHPKRRWIYCLAFLSYLFTKVRGESETLWVAFSLSVVLWIIAVLLATSTFWIYNRSPKPIKRKQKEHSDLDDQQWL